MLVWLKNAIQAPFWFFGGTFPANNVTHRPNPKKDYPWAKPRRLSHKLRILNMVGVNISNLSSL